VPPDAREGAIHRSHIPPDRYGVLRARRQLGRSGTHRESKGVDAKCHDIVCAWPGQDIVHS